jgi:hypothetical protein
MDDVWMIENAERLSRMADDLRGMRENCERAGPTCGRTSSELELRYPI